MAAGTLEQIMGVWWPDLSATAREERRQFVNQNADKDAKNFVEPLLELAPVFDAFHAAGYILGVGTNDSESSAKRHMEVLDVHHYFDVVLGADSVDVPKPSGQMVRRFAELTGITPSEVAMVGDNGHDIEEARAGMLQAAVNTSGAPRRMTIVCSWCAASARLRVRSVRPSASSTTHAEAPARSGSSAITNPS